MQSKNACLYLKKTIIVGLCVLAGGRVKVSGALANNNIKLHRERERLSWTTKKLTQIFLEHHVSIVLLRL